MGYHTNVVGYHGKIVAQHDFVASDDSSSAAKLKPGTLYRNCCLQVKCLASARLCE